VHGVALDLEPLVRSAGGQLDIDLPDHVAVHFLEKNLRSLIYNLLHNAFKYRASDRLPQVCLRAQQEGQQVRIVVQDNGLGMSPAGLRKLFGLFERLHNHVEGSGIGLFMVKKMVENAGGRISVESELGVGSTFTVLLPQ
jgi:signal transduction histidine kinase